MFIPTVVREEIDTHTRRRMEFSTLDQRGKLRPEQKEKWTVSERGWSLRTPVY